MTYVFTCDACGRRTETTDPADVPWCVHFADHNFAGMIPMRRDWRAEGANVIPPKP